MQGKLWDLDWYFCEGFDKDKVVSGNVNGMKKISLPHTVKELPYNNFSHNETAMFSTYVKYFTLDSEQVKRRTVLEFDGVMCYFDLYVNGEPAGSHKGGYSRARFELTGYVHEGENFITVMVDSHERDDIPPFGFTVDYLTYGGIYRDVIFFSLNDVFMSDVYFRYSFTGEKEVTCRPEIVLDNRGEKKECDATFILEDENGNEAFRFTRSLSVPQGVNSIFVDEERLNDVCRWDPENPRLYTVNILLTENGETVDSDIKRVGFREIECRPEGLFVNGRKFVITGMDRHQSYPYAGYAMGCRAQRADADTLKEYGLNAVRTSHYMQSVYFLDRCDELGLLVFEEVPGWGHIGGDEFKKVVLQDVEDMIRTDFNHPSIFLWGVRLNESPDDDELYTKTNKIAHTLDPSRATGGVRWNHNSHLLEDVYTFNDFCHADDLGLDNVLLSQQEVTGLTYKVPFMVTEYMGHTYPVKRFDNEVMLDTHARRHADILARTLVRKDSLGSFGWCAFDYNTHGDCGSGDKICYHGILDMFRIPKYAAWVYRSQKDPDEEIVLRPLTNFARGEKALNGITPFLVATNCDYIEVFMYGQSIGYYFPSNKWEGLKHPLIEVKYGDAAMWGVPWQDGKVIGYINGKAVATYEYARDTYLAGFEVKQDESILSCTEQDTARFQLSFVDQLGHPCLFYNGLFKVETEGDIEVIGPHYIVPVAGQIAFWVRTKPGCSEEKAKVIVSAPETNFETQSFTIELKENSVHNLVYGS